MKRGRALAALLTIAVLAGCGDRRLVLRVDVLSFLDPATTQGAFGPVPAIPGGFASGEQPIVDDLQVNLLDGISDVATVETVTFSLSTMFQDSTGSGTDTMRVYMSDMATDPRATVPVLMMPVVLTAGQSDTLNVVLDGDSRVAELFLQRQMRMTVTTSFRGPSSGADLNGRYQILALDAIVTASRKMD